MTIRKHVTIEREGVIEIRDPALSAGLEAEVDVTVQEPGGDLSYDPTARPIWDLAAEIAASVPDEEWAKVPTDLSIRPAGEESKGEQGAESSGPPRRRSLTRRILEISSSVPLEEWDKLPRDLSMQADHYLYGSPREED